MRISKSLIISTLIYYRKGLVKNCVKSVDEKDEIIVPYLKQTIFILKAAWVKYRKKKKG
jgi:hypothetical protein